MRSCTINGIRVDRANPVLMGVINTSPESFFSGSYVPAETIREAAETMVSLGADLIDIGARSTAPGSNSISVEEEKTRLIRALKQVDGMGIPISVDTMYPEVLETALSYDIHVVNDISGLANTDMARLIADSSIPAILMAANVKPGDCQTFRDTQATLHKVVHRAEEAGIDSYILDPGIGKWIPERSIGADFELCHRFTELHEYNRPLLAAVSRKSFLGAVTGKGPDERLAATLAATSYLLLVGASMIRTHDVAETRDLLTVTTAIRQA